MGAFSKDLQLWILVLGTFISCCIIFINVIFDQALFLQGINFIHVYQQSQPYSIIQVIQNIFSVLCNPRGIAVVTLLYYMLVNRKLMLIVHLSYFLFSIYIVALLKQAFQQSRPIWYDSNIQNWEWYCPKDFGNPSGHSFAVVMLYEPILSDYLGYGPKYWAAFPLLILGAMVPLSRMYLGVHSANQILFGLALGFVCLILFKYVYQKALYQLYWEMLMKNVGRRFVKIAGIAFLNLICIIIPIMFYILNVKNRPMLEKDINNLNYRCGTKLTGVQVQASMLFKCGIGCFYFGLLYGFIMMSDTIGYRKYMLGLWKYEKCIKRFLKVCIFILSMVPALLIIGVAQLVIKDPIAKYLVACVAITLAGFGLSYFAPILAQKCGIIQILPGYAQDYEQKNYNDV